MKQFRVRFWSNYDNLCVSLAWPPLLCPDIIMLPRTRGESETFRPRDKMLHCTMGNLRGLNRHYVEAHFKRIRSHLRFFCVLLKDSLYIVLHFLTFGEDPVRPGNCSKPI